VEGMQHSEPFKRLVFDQPFTWERIKLVHRSLVSAGLLEQIRGSTADVVLKTTALGRQMLEAKPPG